MGNKAKNLRGGASNIKLHAGGGIRFGFMRQNNLSGRTLSVTDVSSYIFDRDSFASYQLRDEDTDINMILAEGEKPQDSYLALSLALKDKWFASLFAALPPKHWLKLKPDDKIVVAKDSVIMPQGWMVSNYRHVLTTKGRKVDGDFRHSSHSELTEYYANPFDYVLLVSEDGEHAIELEKYENGSIKIYATVYRPVSDISESIQFHRPYIVTNNTTDAVYTAVEEAKSSEVAQPKQEPEVTKATEERIVPLTLVQPQEDKTELVASVTETDVATAATAAQSKKPSESTLTELVETALVEAGLNELKPAEIKPAEVKPSEHTNVSNLMLREEETPLPVKKVEQAHTHKAQETMLACDAELVVRVVEEAKRNKLSMADVIRKVIDLPRIFDDKVYVPFDISADEQAALAKRYGFAASDTDAVQKKIVEELRQFAGLD